MFLLSINGRPICNPYFKYMVLFTVAIWQEGESNQLKHINYLYLAKLVIKALFHMSV